MAQLVKELIDDHVSCTEALFGEHPAIPSGMGRERQAKNEISGPITHTGKQNR